LANRRIYSEKLSRCLTSGDCDVSELDKIRSQDQTEIRRFLEKKKAAVIKHSSSVKDALHSDVASWRKTTEHLVSLRGVPNFNFVVLDTPVSILWSYDKFLTSSHIQPWNNVAKYSGTWDSPTHGYGVDHLLFAFVWQNPSDRYAVVNVESYLMLNGFCQAWASGGFLPDNYADLAIVVELNILEYWNDPPTSVPQQSGSSQIPVVLYAKATGFLDLGDYESSGINGSYDVNYHEFAVPPGGVAIFEVTLAMVRYMRGDSFTSYDFASGDFEVMCPALLIGILN
jgi:hypothetical protein